MSTKKLNPAATVDEPPKGRPISGNSTEYGWCKAVPGGTGTTMLAILSSRPPDMPYLQHVIHQIQLSHPILMSKLQSNTSANKFSLITYPKPFNQITFVSLKKATKIIDQKTQNGAVSVTPFQAIIEHEMSMDSWSKSGTKSGCYESEMFFATVYELPGGMWMMALRLHVVACDRTSAVALLRELLAFYGGGGIEKESGNDGAVSLAIEDLVPDGKAKKALWARGIDMLGYSMSSLTLTNLKFKGTRSARGSEMVKFVLDLDDTQRLLDGCKTRGIKLCGALVAAGLIAAHKTNKTKKYGVVTMVDSRSLLQPPLSSHHFGFYHTALLNTHTMRGGERLWELAEKCYAAFLDDKNSQRHFSDMADINYLMSKAIENPSLTPSSSMRTSLLSVFEDTVVDVSAQNRQEAFGVEDYVGCASIHGVGPSIGMFDIIKDGRLDFVCVYPAPLHSREQMQEVVDRIRTVLVDAGK